MYALSARQLIIVRISSLSSKLTEAIVTTSDWQYNNMLHLPSWNSHRLCDAISIISYQCSAADAGNVLQASTDATKTPSSRHSPSVPCHKNHYLVENNNVTYD